MTFDLLPRSGSGGLSGRRRFALVVNSLACGGAETQFVRLAGWLAADGHDVRVWTLLADDDLAADLSRCGVGATVLPQRAPRGPVAIASLAQQLRAFGPDAAISFLYQSNVVTRLAAQIAGVPVVVSSIRNEYFGSRRREALMRCTDRLARVTTTNSELAAMTLTSRRVVSPGRLVVIPNALKPSAFEAASPGRDIRRELGISADEFFWLGVGRLVPQKAWEDVLTAFAMTAATRPARLAVAGEGPLRDRLIALAHALDVEERVRLLGPRRDVRDLLDAADALVLGSSYEGLPNAVLEAMAAGLPVVATAVGGVPELVSPDTGLTVPPGSPHELAVAMTELASLPALVIERMGRSARQGAQRFTEGVVRERWLHLLGELLSMCRRGVRA